MKCPTCQKTVEITGNPFRPFCSERCKTIDLGKWASEIFRIPAPELTEESESSNIPADGVENSSED
jgi:uncharacterized protein